MFVPLAPKWEIINFTMNNPGQCVVPLFVISLDKLAAATYYELYTLLAFSIHSDADQPLPPSLTTKV